MEQEESRDVAVSYPDSGAAFLDLMDLDLTTPPGEDVVAAEVRGGVRSPPALLQAVAALASRRLRLRRSWRYMFFMLSEEVRQSWHRKCLRPEMKDAFATHVSLLCPHFSHFSCRRCLLRSLLHHLDSQPCGALASMFSLPASAAADDKDDMRSVSRL